MRVAGFLATNFSASGLRCGFAGGLGAAAGGCAQPGWGMVRYSWLSGWCSLQAAGTWEPRPTPHRPKGPAVPPTFLRRSMGLTGRSHYTGPASCCSGATPALMSRGADGCGSLAAQVGGAG